MVCGEKLDRIVRAREVILSRNREKHYTGVGYFGYAVKGLLMLISIHSKNLFVNFNFFS
ncbi:hypothetical protein LCGC14_1548470 [marine sediment metagenome]|uniref:Uncharacterized protein n=1 Tax=marine sediment metagenome TaxID=412755 RepID=A0A0F9L715_9ZZZZ